MVGVGIGLAFALAAARLQGVLDTARVVDALALEGRVGWGCEEVFLVLRPEEAANTHVCRWG